MKFWNVARRLVWGGALLERLKKYCSHSGSQLNEAVFLVFDFVSAQSQGFLNLLLRQSLAKNQKSSLRIGRSIFLTALAGSICLVFQASAQRITLNFNPDWKFTKSDPADAQTLVFNDNSWTAVSLPHNYVEPDIAGESATHNVPGEQGGARGWYRKTFTVPQSFQGKRIYVEFEAVRQVAEVYLNGKLLGTSKTGFLPFGFDLTPDVQFGKSNVLAVRYDNRFVQGQPENAAETTGGISDAIEALQAEQIPWNSPRLLSADGGIYRNVRLYVMDPLHISLPLYSFLQTAGPYVYASEISPESARVNVEVPIENSRRTGEHVELVAQVLDRSGAALLTMRHEVDVVAGASAKFNLSGVLPKPEFWEPDYPYLYRIVCALKVNGQTVDNTEMPLGIRTASWNKDRGFFINGHHEKLHGWAQRATDEWLGLGAAQPDWMHFYTLNLMKEAGANWVRWMHAAAGPEMISACNQLGLMVEQPGVDGEVDAVGAAWKLRASAFRDMIIYYRNDPAILVWEGGREKITREHAAELHAYVKAYDPHGGRAYAHAGSNAAEGDLLNVGIGNDGSWELKNLPVVEGGYDREKSLRGVWDDFSRTTSGAAASNHLEHFLTSEEFAVDQVAQYLKKIGMPEHSGGANWMFSDSTGNESGEVDETRLPKEAYYVCRAMFNSRDPQVHIIGHWNYFAGTKKTVYVVSNCERVELFVNGKSLGFGETASDARYIFTFKNVAWEPGEIKAVGISERRIAALHSRRTAGRAVSLRLIPRVNPNGGLRADGSDIWLIDVEALDAKGERCVNFEQPVYFELKGEGTWQGAYESGKTNSSHNPVLNLAGGINRAAVRATRTAGKISFKVTSPGLKSATLSLKSVPLKLQNGFSTELPATPAASLPSMRPSSASK
jgi:beta-galactosidase